MGKRKSFVILRTSLYRGSTVFRLLLDVLTGQSNLSLVISLFLPMKMLKITL